MLELTEMFCTSCLLQRGYLSSKRTFTTSRKVYKLSNKVSSIPAVQNLKRSNVSRTHVLNSESWGQKILAAVETEGFQLCQDKDIFECNPGNGVLTKALLQKGLKVVCWETNRNYTVVLKELAEKYNGQLQVFTNNFFRNTNFKPGDGMLHVTQEEKLVVLGPVFQDLLQIYLANLVGAHILPAEVTPLHHATHFLITTHKECEMMLSSNPHEVHMSHGTFRHVLYNHFFHTKAVLKIPITAFKSSRLTAIQSDKWDRHHLYLVRLDPDWSKLDVLNRTDVPGLVLFIKYLNQRKKKRLIPVVEQCCPGLGLVLIQRGYSMLQLVRDLSMEDYIPLYQSLLESDSYHNSALKEEIEQYKQFLLGSHATDQRMKDINISGGDVQKIDVLQKSSSEGLEL